MNPLVSIVIPVYNGSNYLKKAIDSALSQTYKNIEVIVINDGSTDDTEKIALSYGEKIKYVRKENGGVSTALNLGIKKMKGKYFSWLSHDDEYSPYKIEHQINALSKYNDDTLLALCSNNAIDKNSNPYKGSTKDKLIDGKIYTWQEALLLMLKKGTFNGCAFLIPKKVFDDVGLFDENLRYCQDSFMWTHMFIKGYSLLFNNNVDVSNRIHNLQVTQTRKDLLINDFIACANELIPIYLDISTKKFNFIYYFGRMNAINGVNEVVDEIINNKKERNLSQINIIKLKIMKIYGKIRPLIRRMYYKIFRKVKTR